jgi:putative hemolysin
LATLLTTRFFIQAGWSKTLGVLLNVVVVTFLILLISEISPKVFAVKNSQQFSLGVVPVVSLIYIFFFPLTLVIDKGLSFFISILRLTESEEERLFRPEELQSLLELGEEQGELEAEEKELLHSIFEFGDTIVREIMIPRTDMVCVSHDTTTEDLIGTIKFKGHTRIPVFEETIDRIRGIINAKDLLPSVSDKQASVDLLELARPAIFVPESKKIDDLLKLFQKERQHMAIVVDEYGGTAGLVTLEDVLEEIVGEIRDEYDREVDLYKIIDETSLLVNAKIDVHSLNELIDINIPEQEEYDTLGGFIFDLTGSVPGENDVVHFGAYELVMVKVERNRIVNVRINKKGRASSTSESSMRQTDSASH